MNILVIGDEICLAETKAKFGDVHHYLFTPSQLEGRKQFVNIDVVFDFIMDEDPSQMEVYRDRPSLMVFISAAKVSLRELVQPLGIEYACTFFGFNGLPTFLKRPILECSLLKKEDHAPLENICKQLGSEFLVVEDRVGLVTPRVICMIINEAYYTVAEGIATREDIDLAMKLGTGYPFGPFEWSRNIGVKNVYELLEAVYKESQDPRYLICPLLAEEARI